jgi:hypothetical protein
LLQHKVSPGVATNWACGKSPPACITIHGTLPSFCKKVTATPVNDALLTSGAGSLYASTGSMLLLQCTSKQPCPQLPRICSEPIFSYYQHGSDREAFTFEITMLEVIHHPEEVPPPDLSTLSAGPSSPRKRRGSPLAHASPKKKSFRPKVRIQFAFPFPKRKSACTLGSIGSTVPFC